MTLTEFLLARIAEDEALARKAVAERDRINWLPGCEPGPDTDAWTDIDNLSAPAVAVGAERWLAECAAKRAVAELHDECGSGVGYCDDGGHGWDHQDGGGCFDLAALAGVYATHRDFNPDWQLG